MRLLIISHTPHYRQGDSAVGWGSTVREVDQLATLFAEVVHLAPLHPGPAPGSALPYQASNIRLVPLRPAGGEGLAQKLGVFRQVPGWLSAMKAEMQRVDALHIRCPAGVSLVALLGARLWGRSKPTWVKYAGNWLPEKDPLTYALQRSWLRHNFHRGVVTVNGAWPRQAAHILSFHNPSYSLADYHQASRLGREKTLQTPIQLLFVGRIEAQKGVGRLVEIASLLKAQGLPFSLTLVGDGPARPRFEKMVREAGLARQVRFAGWQPRVTVNEHYQTAHILLHPSTASEGWPKVLSEAMAHGAVPIASTVSSIPQILAETGAGLTIPTDDLQTYAEAILKYTQDADRWKRASLKGIAAGERFTYEHYLARVRAMFADCWQLDLNHG